MKYPKFEIGNSIEKYKEQFNYYVYIFTEPYEDKYLNFLLSNGEVIRTQGIPFYVGKGKTGRCLNHFKKYHKKNTPFYSKLKSLLDKGYPKDDMVWVVKFFENEKDAYEYESFLIKEIGSDYIDGIKGGPLKNMTTEQRPLKMKGSTFEEMYGIEKATKIKEKIKLNNSGQFTLGHKMSEETRLKISNSHKERIAKEKINGTFKKVSQETRKKFSDSNLRRFSSGEIPAKQCSWKIIDNNGVEFILDRTYKGGLKKYCKENKISYTAMCNSSKTGKTIERGKQKGWQAINLTK